MSQLWNPVKKVADTALGAFGPGEFGRRAERFAQVFGTPAFLLGQTVFVAIWIVMNGIAVAYRWDPYPFILLNLMFSLQAAYAAPLILLAQTRQAERERLFNDADREQRESIAQATLENQVQVLALLESLNAAVEANKALIEEVAATTESG